MRAIFTPDKVARLKKTERAVALFTISLVLAMSSPGTHALSTGVYSVHGDNPQQLQQSIEKLYGDQAAVGISDGQLIVRAKAEVLEEIGKLIARLESGARTLHITLSATGLSPDKGRQYATAGAKPRTLSVAEGKPLLLLEEHTRERPQSNGIFWNSIEDIPNYKNSISVVPRVMGQSVELEVSYYYQSNNRRRHTTATLNGQLGDWIAVVNDLDKIQADGSIKQVSTGVAGGGSLFIQVRLAQ